MGRDVCHGHRQKAPARCPATDLDPARTIVLADPNEELCVTRAVLLLVRSPSAEGMYLATGWQGELMAYLE